jgi:hypothetical protein
MTKAEAAHSLSLTDSIGCRFSKGELNLMSKPPDLGESLLKLDIQVRVSKLTHATIQGTYRVSITQRHQNSLQPQIPFGPE